MSPLPFLVLPLLAACEPAPAPAAPASTEDTSASASEDSAASGLVDDTGPTGVEVPVPAPAWSAAEVAARITDALGAGIPEPMTARAEFMSLFAHRDERCPGGGDISLPGRFQGCTAASGWLYAGIATYAGPDDPRDLNDFAALADGYIISPDGDWFIGAGELEYAVQGGQDGGPFVWEGSIRGRWSYPLAEGWMRDEEASASLDLTGAGDGTVWQVTADGALHLGGADVLLSAVSAQSFACGGEPSGLLALRDPSGYRYTLALDCGCGTVRWADGSDLGEVCISAAAPLADLVAKGRP